MVGLTESELVLAGVVPAEVPPQLAVYQYMVPPETGAETERLVLDPLQMVFNVAFDDAVPGSRGLVLKLVSPP